MRALQELHSAGRDAEQDAARLALLHLQQTKARRPQALLATLRLPADITINTLLERYLPETLEKETYEVTWKVSFSGLCL